MLDKVHNTYDVLDIPSSPSGPSGIDAALIEKNEVVRAVPAKAHAVDARRAEQKLLFQLSVTVILCYCDIVIL